MLLRVRVCLTHRIQDRLAGYRAPAHLASPQPERRGRVREAAAVQGHQPLLGNLKTAIAGTYHTFDFAKYAHRYLAEFQFRFNHSCNMKTILHSLLVSLLATPASPESWLRTAEVHR